MSQPVNRTDAPEAAVTRALLKRGQPGTVLNYLNAFNASRHAIAALRQRLPADDFLPRFLGAARKAVTSIAAAGSPEAADELISDNAVLDVDGSGRKFQESPEGRRSVAELRAVLEPYGIPERRKRRSQTPTHR